MHSSELQTNTLHGVRISKDTARFFSLTISIDGHGEDKSVQNDARTLVYSHALLSGCGTYSRDAFLDAVNLLGATLSVSVNNGILSIALSCQLSKQAQLMSLFETMIKEPTFSTSEIKRIVELLGNELDEEKEDSKAQSLIGLYDSAFDKKDRRYVFVPDELKKVLGDIKKSDLLAIHRRFLSRQWVYTIATKTALSKKTEERIKKLRSRFPEPTEKAFISKPITLTKRKIVLNAIPSKQNIEINIGAALPLLSTDEEYPAFVFGLSVLGKWGGFAGRLMSTVREKEGLTYGIYARTETASAREQGYWRIMTFFAPDKAIIGINATLREMKAIREKGITQKEFERFKNIIATEQILKNDSFLRQASEIHAYLLKHYTLPQIALYKEKLTQVTRAEVNRALKKYLEVDSIVISAAGPTVPVQKELKSL